MRKPSWDLKKAMGQYGFTPVELPERAEYEAGKTYWCGYWQQWYKVLNAVYEQCGQNRFLKETTVQWHDNTITTHCTSLDPMRDWELVWKEN